MQQDQNPYGFILDSGAQPKKSGLGGWLPRPGNKRQRILFAVAGGGILLVIMLTAFSLIFSSGTNREQLLKLAQSHAELVRVAEIGTDKARGPEARNLAATTKLALQSSQSELMAVINEQSEVSSKELAAGQNPETDTILTAAEQSNRFDEVFLEILTRDLGSYQQQLQTVYDASSSETNRRVYSDIFDQVTALLPEQE